jgi:inosine triphosphate pyrophosphatase
MSNSPLYFITGNAGKFREISAIVAGLEKLELDLDEIQSLDPQAVIEHKLTQAAAQHSGEFIVEDTSLIFNCLNGLPGTMIKWFVEQLDNEGMADLVSRYDDRTAVARCTIGYRSLAGETHYFTGEVHGQIVPPRGTVSVFGWNSIFEVQDTGRTFAEMTIEEKNRLSMRGLAAQKLAAYRSNPSAA